MNILSYIVMVFCWTLLVWGICTLAAARLKKLETWPLFWLCATALCVLTPLMSALFVTIGAAPFINAAPLSPVLDTMKTNISERQVWIGLGKMFLWVYLIGICINIYTIARAWIKLSKAANKPPAKKYKSIDIITTKQEYPPCSFGLVRPVILMPAHLYSKLSSEEIELIYKHEAAHIKARDPLIMTVLLIVKAVYWPHPAIHNLFTRWQLAAEFSADNFALKGATPNLRRQYGLLLVDVLRRCSSREALPCPSASLNLSNYRSAKMRVKYIMNPSGVLGKSQYGGFKLLMSASAALFGGALAMSAVAGEGISPDKNAQLETRYPPVFPSNCPASEGKFAAQVDIKFDVNKAGSIENVRITKSDNPCFNENSVRSVSKWQYKPSQRRLKNVETRLVFMMQEKSSSSKPQP